MPPIIEGQLVPSGGQMPVGTIGLGQLIDYSLQRTYHELTVLSELLPRKTDMERKIEIFQFASRTRQLFVRLLALVKWASNAGKVDKCTAISQFLDQQAMLFVDTADVLARTARETLVHARLPSFSIHSAIDVLTSGSYPRLPLCIREKIVPPDPISAIEKRDTLMKLNRIIQNRLVSTDLPTQLRRLTVENGRVRFIVEHEFEVTLTLMGEGPNIPWRLLEINILVQDPETGDGKPLVHTLQVQYIHQLIQTRIFASDQPLQEVYNCLHTFCQSLQLEVLHSQAQGLIRERLGDRIVIDRYVPGSCLGVSYWRNQSSMLHYQLSVHTNETGSTKPLQISHSPPLHGSAASQVPHAIKSDQLSLEKLLVQTIQVRSVLKLKELEIIIKSYAVGDVIKNQEIPPVLQCPLVDPCLPSENLHFSVDSQRGTYLVSCPYFGSRCPLASDLEAHLNDTVHIKSSAKLESLFSSLRLWIVLRQMERRVQHLHITTSEQLPLVHATGHRLEKLGPNKLYFKICRQTGFYLVVDVAISPSHQLNFSYWLLKTSPAIVEGGWVENADGSLPMPFVRPGHMVQLDSFASTHGPYTKMERDVYGELDLNAQQDRKRKILLGFPPDSLPKRPRLEPDHLSTLCHMLAMCDERIPFITLADEMQKQGITHQGVSVEPNGVCLSITVTSFPPVPGCPGDEPNSLEDHLLSCTLRLMNKIHVRNWMTEFVFTKAALVGTQEIDSGPIRRICFHYEHVSNENVSKTVDQLSMCWKAMCHIHKTAMDFLQVYKDVKNGLSCSIDVQQYTYKKIVLAYGTNRSNIVSVKWRPETCLFQLHFSSNHSGATCSNPHSIVASQLTNEMNEHNSLAQLAQVLHETFHPLSAINKLNTRPMLGLPTKDKQPLSNFTILPQSSTRIKILYRNLYCLDIHLRGDRLVAIRDGASSKSVDGLYTIQNFKAFLNIFVDDHAADLLSRRRSTAEDDNPPSPPTMDVDFLSQQPSTSSPGTRGKSDGAGTLRFGSPMTSPANPHTPASPGASRVSSQQSFINSPAAGFPLASPPSIQMGTPSPGTGLPANSPGNLHVPSPSSFVPAPSPGTLNMHMTSPSPFISPQGLVESGSPFANPSLVSPSPGVRNWPGSPSVSGPSPVSRHGAATSPALHSPQKEDYSRPGILSPPSKVLPQRSLAASVPTLLSNDALYKLMSPSALPGQTSYPLTCPLERFLGCVFMKRNLLRVLQEGDIKLMQSDQPGVIMFCIGSLQYRVSLNTTNLQTLQVKVIPVQEYKEPWTPDEIQTLEKYFETKVLCPPYKANSVIAFGRLLKVPYKILKDCVQIIKCELVPDPNLKWSLQLCLTVPGGSSYIASTGQVAVASGSSNSKILVMIRLSNNCPVSQGESACKSFTVSILHDVEKNTTQLLEVRKNTTPNVAHPAHPAIVSLLRKFAVANSYSDCTFYPAIRELLTNLVIPS